jgi:hypothetical protein
MSDKKNNIFFIKQIVIILSKLRAIAWVSELTICASRPPMDAHFLSGVRVCLSFNSSEMSGRIKMKFSGHEETISEGAYF